MLLKVIHLLQALPGGIFRAASETAHTQSDLTGSTTDLTPLRILKLTHQGVALERWRSLITTTALLQRQYVDGGRAQQLCSAGSKFVDVDDDVQCRLRRYSAAVERPHERLVLESRRRLHHAHVQPTFA